MHEERGPLSVRNIFDLAADRGERHLEQILEMRRLLGKPIVMELLLTERLLISSDPRSPSALK